MKVKVKKMHPRAQVPTYGRVGDAGLDLYATEASELRAGMRAAVPTGIAFEIPDGYVGLVWGRSGLASRFGIVELGGVIDSNFRGELKVLLWNSGSETLCIEVGDRVAQLVIQPLILVQCEEVEDLTDTVRAEAAFGSSGR
jgi:dUTP pyrophosphatase